MKCLICLLNLDVERQLRNRACALLLFLTDKIKDIVSPSQCLDIAKVSGDKFYSKEEVERKKYIITFTLCSEHQMREQSNYHSTQTLG